MNDKITEMYAFVVIDDGMGQGNEGIPALSLNGMAMPMVGADMARVDSLRKIAQEMTLDHGRIELRKFTSMEVVEVYEGK